MAAHTFAVVWRAVSGNQPYWHLATKLSFGMKRAGERVLAVNAPHILFAAQAVASLHPSVWRVTGATAAIAVLRTHFLVKRFKK